ncbi:ferredoxin [Jatrophihabitans fulvus]
MKIFVEQSKCSGHARCYATAPEVFPIDDDGYTALDGEVDVPDELAEKARFGVAACPEKALRVLAD